MSRSCLNWDPVPPFTALQGILLVFLWLVGASQWMEQDSPTRTFKMGAPMICHSLPLLSPRSHPMGCHTAWMVLLGFWSILHSEHYLQPLPLTSPQAAAWGTRTSPPAQAPGWMRWTTPHFKEVWGVLPFKQSLSLPNSADTTLSLWYSPHPPKPISCSPIQDTTAKLLKSAPTPPYYYRNWWDNVWNSERQCSATQCIDKKECLHFGR
ncbi:hypothetical protein FKM82_023114 [Ascaphus truei]